MAGEDQIQKNAKELLPQAEGGQDVSEKLNNMPIEERVATAREMQRMNDERRTDDKNVPKLEMDIQKDAAGREHVMDMKVLRNPEGWLSKDRKDIYNMPPGAEGLRNIPMMGDSLAMAADSRDNLGNQKTEANSYKRAFREQ